MTRQELEKKKCIKLSQRDASPAEALISSIKDKPAEKPKKSEEVKPVSAPKAKSDKEDKETSAAEVAEAINSLNDKKKYLKTKHYSIRLPEDMAEDMNLAKFIYGDLAKYVRTLIQKDMEKNRANYAEVKARAQSLF